MPKERPAKKLQVYNDPGHAHELTFSVFHRHMKMFETGVVEAFLSSLVTASQELKFDIWAYVVMPDHVHLLLYPREEVYSISEIRKAIKQPSSEAIFKLHPEWRRAMRVTKARGIECRYWQQGGGYDRNMFTPEIIRAAIDYIHENPVRKGLAESSTEWPWSSARNYAGLPGEIPVALYSWES